VSAAAAPFPARSHVKFVRVTAEEARVLRSIREDLGLPMSQLAQHALVVTAARYGIELGKPPPAARARAPRWQDAPVRREGEPLAEKVAFSLDAISTWLLGQLSALLRQPDQVVLLGVVLRLQADVRAAHGATRRGP
jgi:hypothetical protein